MSPTERLSRAQITKATNMDLPISALEAITSMRRCLDELEDGAIDAAVEKGATWQMIADALGVSRQAVSQRLRKRRQSAASAAPADLADTKTAAAPSAS
jgi:CRP-like cAMP-binding protein